MGNEDLEAENISKSNLTPEVLPLPSRFNRKITSSVPQGFSEVRTVLKGFLYSVI
jgi:hypothetical protein